MFTAADLGIRVFEIGGYAVGGRHDVWGWAKVVMEIVGMLDSEPGGEGGN